MSSFRDFDARIKKLKSSQAIVLALWAALNIVLGGLFSLFSLNLYYYFHLMNFTWGIVNAFVAAFVYLHHNKDLTPPQPLLKQMDHQRHAEKIILFNIGLDVAFMVSGIALYLNGNGISTTYPELWKGFGISVLMQGAFLFVQDNIFYWLHLKNREKVYPLWQKALDDV